ncbi:hypothetical protein R5N98_13915 [Tenacibaculum maritimum]|uniref:hypothetical protein n=1 Tax=Tenacibaculum maritimum TaxID=107401 RepID=UPI0012E62FC0|nr:hypothetical protein [Tenacibaculum maritimum]MCD9637406.1 hypothetical protein [Tenacibaculum maritimum]CAA0148265.1 Probable transmembrane hypothetical protein [Tenacibaculum maritimum]
MKQPHRILEYPTVYDKDFISKIGEEGMLKQADDQIFFESHRIFLTSNLYWGIGGIVVGVWLIASTENNQQRILPILLILGGLFWMFYGLYANKNYKIFELNRLTGMVTYPDSYFRKPLKGRFKELHAVITVTGGVDDYVDSEYLKFVNTFNPRRFTLLYTFYGSEPYKDWSFYVWYMDKNRPLPPGEIFDAYRERDFERRKKLGFPKPLYGSNIPTPEATPAQQAERERIGGW